MRLRNAKISAAFVVVLAVPAMAQWTVKFRYTCPAGERFVVTLCHNCKPHYCYDGQHFSEEDGGAVPVWLKSYFESSRQQMKETREEIARRGEEMKAQWERAKAETQRLNEESARRSKAWNDGIARRTADIQAVTRHGGAATPGYGTGVAAGPKVQVVGGLSEPASAPTQHAPAAVQAEMVRSVQVGARRSAVMEALGNPHSAMSVPDDAGMRETLTYILTSGHSATVVLREGLVIEVSLPD